MKIHVLYSQGADDFNLLGVFTSIERALIDAKEWAGSTAEVMWSEPIQIEDEDSRSLVYVSNPKRHVGTFESIFLRTMLLQHGGD